MKLRVFKSNREFEKFIEEMTNSTYVPTTKEEILDMEYIELKCRMTVNLIFYNAAIALLEEEVAKMMVRMRTWSRKLKKAQNLEEVLNAKYFGENYEDSRSEFVTVFLDMLWML